MEKRKILLVEDDPDHAEIIIETLEADGETTVILRKNGQEAIDYFAKDGNNDRKLDLVVLDLNLPKVQGMEVLKFLKGDLGNSSFPVIVLSTSSSRKTIDEAYRNGANAYVTKHASYDVFVKNIEKLKQYYNPPPSG